MRQQETDSKEVKRIARKKQLMYNEIDWYFHKRAEADLCYMHEILPRMKNMDEFEKLVQKRPHLYERYRKLTERHFEQRGSQCMQ